MNPYEISTLDLCNYIEKSPTSYHAVASASKMFSESGFTRLWENEIWKLIPGGNYYVTRNDCSIIAFTLPKKKPSSFKIIASHSDSPSFKIKEHPEIEKASHYIMLNIEKYGGALLAPWFDRPLGIAGRLIVQEQGSIRSILVDSGRDLLMIPSLAIHMDRQANEKSGFKIQTHLLPVFGDETAVGGFTNLLAEFADVEPSHILGTDLFVYNRSPYSIWGYHQEFFSSPRLDDLQCAYASIKALLSAKIPQQPETQKLDSAAGKGSIHLCSIFDNEEVGSCSKQGADSTFLQDTLERICLCLGLTRQDQLAMLASSFMLSADNAHAIHPAHTEKADPTNAPYMNGGVVIKYNASQKYTTDALSAGIFRTICQKADVPVQTYFNHSDIPGGSTLGNISSAHVSIPSVDIGCAQLAMHSPYETAGIKDTYYMIKAMEAFYNTEIHMEAGSGTYVL